MFPGLIAEYLPGQLHLFAQSSEGAGLPVAAQAITVTIVSSATRGPADILNNADGSIVTNDLQVSTHGLKRYAGLWWLDVSLFQQSTAAATPATLELRERTYDLLTQPVAGAADTTRQVWIRRVRHGVLFRATWRLVAAESRLNYVNGSVDTTAFDLTVQLRAV